MKRTFDATTAFRAIATWYPDLRELLRGLGKLRWDNIHLLPASYEAADLMELARARGWLLEHRDGSFTIKVPK